jgi:hypothetical protein
MIQPSFLTLEVILSFFVELADFSLHDELAAETVITHGKSLRRRI